MSDPRTLFGPDAPPAGARVVVAMSGGVDSSVVAALARDAGYETVGITLQLYDHGAAVRTKGACCAGQDIRDARAVAERLGIDHYVLDYESRFREAVIQDFADSYARGETPIPCIRCNQTVKFADLLTAARDLGAAALATGHYVRRAVGPQGPELHRGADPARDQSYFLFATTAAQLDFLRFPLGGLDKAATRALAGRLALPVAAKPDSQDICFVPEGRYDRIVERLRPEAAEPGEIRHLDGRLLGRHEGIIRYTVGQRRGLGLDHEPGPLYVVRLDALRRQVIVGPEVALGRDLVELGESNWLEAPAEGRAVAAKLRSAQPAQPAHLLRLGGGWGLRLEAPQKGVAPGQAAVCYDGERVIGGGFIRAASLSEDLAA